ncbi:hypothetical protein J7353_10095 [Micrococcus luteus]|nr:hypothetical protein [Micrococcus luteus]
MTSTTLHSPASPRPQETAMTTLATRPRTASARRTADTLLHGPAHSPAVLPRGEEIARRARTEQGREELRRVRSLAAVIAVACVEVETGRRALRDLSAWLSPEVLDKLTRRMELLGAVAPTGPGRRSAAAVPPRAPASAPRPVGARVCEVAPGRVEASATVLWEGRARAFALRLERRLSRWKVTSVEIG